MNFGEYSKVLPQSDLASPPFRELWFYKPALFGMDQEMKFPNVVRLLFTKTRNVMLSTNIRL